MWMDTFAFEASDFYSFVYPYMRLGYRIPVYKNWKKQFLWFSAILSTSNAEDHLLVLIRGTYPKWF